MTKIEQSTLDFLTNIAKNNTREWYHENKSDYQKAKQNYQSFIDELILNLAAFDSEVQHVESKSVIFRIFKDVRFSKDKSPYKTNLGAFICKDGKKSGNPGYYFHLEPEGKSMVAVGTYMPPKENLKLIRDGIDYDAQELRDILSNKDFKEAFGDLAQDAGKLKTAPKGFPKDHPDIDLLKYKSYIAVSPLSDETILSENLIQVIIERVKKAYPLNQFLNKTLRA